MKFICIFICILLLVIKIGDASFCGNNALPFSFEITEDNNFILKCVKPKCLNWPKAHIFQRYRVSRLQFYGSHNRTHTDNGVLNFATCQKTFVSRTCSNNGEWIGGIKEVKNIFEPLHFRCCKHNALKASKFLKTFVIQNGGSVEGGDIKIDGKMIGFDYISNIEKITADPLILFKIYVNRYPCKTEDSEATKFRNTFFINSNLHNKMNSTKLYQASIFKFDNGNSIEDEIENLKIKGCGTTSDNGWNGCDENAIPVPLDACQILSPFDANADNSDAPDVTGGTAITSAMAVEQQQPQRSRLFQAPIFFPHPRLYQAPIADVDGSGEDPLEEDFEENDVGSDGNSNTKVKLDACPPPPLPSPQQQNPIQMPPPPPTPPPITPPPITPTPPPPMMMMQCFSGDTIVTLKNNQKKRLDDLTENDDWILSAGDNRIGYNKIISWLHRMPEEEAEFLKFTLENGNILKVTRNHFIYRVDCSAKYNQNEQYKYFSTVAEKILPSDCLLSLNNESTQMVLTRISKIETVFEKGIYAPLTDSGNIIVNNIFASCYSEIDNQSLHFHLHFINQFYERLSQISKIFYSLFNEKFIQNEIDLIPGMMNLIEIVKNNLL